MASERENAALLALLSARPGGASWGQIATEVAFEGSAEAVLRRIDSNALFAAPELEDDLQRATSILNDWRERDFKFLTVLDPEYPARLLDIRETPPFLFSEGDIRAHDVGMSVVGSRNASAEGLQFADAIARHLVDEGLTVIAGLAAGIDAAAHQAALAEGGRTVAFLGTGITKRYPAENAALQDEIASRGLVVSQFYPDQPPTKQTFPIRNAAMSGYGLATIVVEAGEKSGTRIQARVAGEHGRPVILTARVVRETSWGAALVGSPNVQVVANLGELKAAVRHVLGAREALTAALAAPAGAW